MFKQLKKIFSRGGGTETQGWASSAVAERTEPKPSNTRFLARPVGAAPVPARPAVRTPEYNDEEVSIPLQSVLNNLPSELKSRVIPMDLGGATMTVAVHKVLSQLPQGAVKLSFGELRRAAPQLFSPGEQFDQQDFDLPLNEILVRMNPALLPQSPAQKAPATDVMENCFNAPQPARPASKLQESPAPGSRSPQGPMRVPLPAPPATPPPAVDETPINVALAPLAADWPTEVRAEISQLNCVEAQIILPGRLVQQGMKQGKVAFSWQTIRSWIQPTPPSVVSKHDEVMLELPLEVLMPLFITRLKQVTRTQPRLVVDESIPALFGPAASAEAPAPVVGNGGSSATDTSFGKPKTPSTDFKNRYISPTEVVERAAALDGVAGTLVVLPEGLVVAARLSTDQNPDGLAAFAARALGRVNKCAEESFVGVISHLDVVTASGVPWRIFRLHGVLLAAFGQAGGTLPTPQLATLASEFDRKKRG